MLVIGLPLPPSTNRLWRQGRGRVYRSEQYERWTKQVGQELMIARVRPIQGPVKIAIDVSVKSRKDLDNHGKPVIDSLVKFGIIEGDDKKIVKSVSLKWDASVKGIRVTVAPTL